MDLNEWRIATFALSSRAFILILQCLANALIPDHDAKVFNPPRDKSNFSWADQITNFLLSGLRRWDAVYFTHIMQFGYTYENCVAFFPLYPLVASSFSSCLQILGILSPSSWILLTSVLLNVVLFVVTAVLLYKLGKCVMKIEVAFYGALMFCVNPASIFMTAPYSESLYMFLLMLALLKLQEGALFTSSLFVGLSVFTRSNGIVGIGFLLHYIAKSLILNLKVSVLARHLNLITSIQHILYLLLQALTKAVICFVLSLAPFFLYQFYIYQHFCLLLSSGDSLPDDLMTYGRSQGYHLFGDKPSPWCSDHLPLSYSYIQKHHWDVGFLHYYQIKQIPNFLLASPIIILSFEACRYFFKINPQPFYTLGLYPAQGLANSQTWSTEQKSDVGNVDRRLAADSPANSCRRDSCVSEDRNAGNTVATEDILVYVFHLICLTLFGCCFMHIQTIFSEEFYKNVTMYLLHTSIGYLVPVEAVYLSVLTRLLCSSSPLLYWYAGALYVEDNPKTRILSRQNSFVKEDTDLQSRISTKTGALKRCLRILTEFHCGFIVDVVLRWSGLSFKFRAVFIYCILYCTVGTIMFSNFLPWT